MGAANLYLGHLRQLPPSTATRPIWVSPDHVMLIETKDDMGTKFDIWMRNGAKFEAKNTTIEELMEALGFIAVNQGVRVN